MLTMNYNLPESIHRLEQLKLDFKTIGVRYSLPLSIRAQASYDHAWDMKEKIQIGVNTPGIYFMNDLISYDKYREQFLQCIKEEKQTSEQAEEFKKEQKQDKKFRTHERVTEQLYEAIAYQQTLNTIPTVVSTEAVNRELTERQRIAASNVNRAQQAAHKAQIPNLWEF